MTSGGVCADCGAPIRELRTTANPEEQAFDREPVRGGAWVLQPAAGYAFRRGAGPRLGYQLHRCESVPEAAPAASVIDLFG